MVDKNMQCIPSPVEKLGVQNIARFIFWILRIPHLNRLSINELQLINAINHSHINTTLVIAFIMNNSIIMRFQRCLIEQHFQHIFVLNLSNSKNCQRFVFRNGKNRFIQIVSLFVKPRFCPMLTAIFGKFVINPQRIDKRIEKIFEVPKCHTHPISLLSKRDKRANYLNLND